MDKIKEKKWGCSFLRWSDGWMDGWIDGRLVLLGRKRIGNGWKRGIMVELLGLGLLHLSFLFLIPPAAFHVSRIYYDVCIHAHME